MQFAEDRPVGLGSTLLVVVEQLELDLAVFEVDSVAVGLELAVCLVDIFPDDLDFGAYPLVADGNLSL